MSIIDRDNRMAVAWGMAYSAAVVLCVGLGDALAIPPTITVPAVVVALPIALGLASRHVERILERRRRG